MYFMTQAFPFMFTLVFVLVICVFAFVLFRGVTTWSKNNHSPVLTVQAAVVAKRANTTHHHQTGTDQMSHSSTSYYATFQFDSGDRLELPVPSGEYGYLIEGDHGKLTFQGTRFHSFERQ